MRKLATSVGFGALMSFAICVSPEHSLPGHVERLERVEAVASALRRSLLDEPPTTDRLASREELVLVHSSDLIDRLEAIEIGPDVKERHVVLADEDDPDGVTYATSTSYRDARRAVGAVLDLVDSVYGVFGSESGMSKAFAAIRPPGHHCTRSKSMGFCLVNNVAVAVAYARKRHGANAVLIVDFDLHNGNGTVDIFYDDPDVFVVDIHEENNVYKDRDGEGDVGAGCASTMNIPLKAGSGHASVVALCSVIADVAAKFKPDLVAVSAGSDAHVEDPFNTDLGVGFAFTDESYRVLGACLRRVADAWSDGKLLCVLEGGYNCDALARSFSALVAGVCTAEEEGAASAAHVPTEKTTGDVASEPVVARARARAFTMKQRC